MTYRPDQLLEIAPLIEDPIEWFVLGGPADGNEAQNVRARWPQVRIIAIEPLEANVQWQLAHEFPRDAVIMSCALGRTNSTGALFLNKDESNGHRCSSLNVGEEAAKQRDSIQVEITSLDTLDKTVGPFNEVFLWLDIEGFEYEALLGARDLLTRKSINYVNVEFLHRREELNEQIHTYLQEWGFEALHRWNVNYARQGEVSHYDQLYVRTEHYKRYRFADPSMTAACIHANKAATTHLWGKPIQCLEIGVYDGRSACWFLDNVLTHPDARYVGVDYIGEHKAAHERAIRNLSRNHPGKYELIVGDSLRVVPALQANERSYDLIHIDGCHSPNGCLGDLRNSWPLLKRGGVMICDDFYRADYGVAQAVHKFLSELTIARDYRIDHVGASIAWTKLETSL